VVQKASRLALLNYSRLRNLLKSSIKASIFSCSKYCTSVRVHIQSFLRNKRISCNVEHELPLNLETSQKFKIHFTIRGIIIIAYNAYPDISISCRSNLVRRSHCLGALTPLLGPVLCIFVSLSATLLSS
jgi:hypothetical protein